MPVFVTYLTYADVFGHPITEDDLIARIKPLSLHDCLQSVGKLSHLLASDDPEAMNEAASFIRSGLRTPGAHVLLHGKLVYGGRRPLFNKQLMALGRLALLHAEDRPPDSFNNRIEIWRFVEALLGVVDVYGNEDSIASVKSGVEAEEWMASFRLRRVGMPERVLRQSVVRALRVFVDLPQQHPELITSVAPAQAFETAIGVSLERYLAICFGIITRFAAWDRSPDSWLLGKSYWADSILTEDEVSSTIATVAATPTKLRSEFEALEKNGETSIDDIRPFLIYPLIEIEPGIFTPADVEALGDTLLGDGLFWRLKPKPGPGTTDKERSDFGESLGHLLERHCVDVAESVYPQPASPRRLFSEFRYKISDGDEVVGHDGPDIVVTDDRASAFIEIGIDRPNLRDTVIRGDLASYDADVERLILPRAEQLDRKVRHALAGHLRFQGAPPDSLRRIHPVICFWDGFPLGRYLYERIEKAVQAAGFLQQEEVAPLTIISVQELEQLLDLVGQGYSLTDLLHRHITSNLKTEPLNDYLHERFGDRLYMPSLMAAEFERIGERLRAQLFGNG